MAERDLTVRIDGNARGSQVATAQAESSMRGMGDGKTTGATGKLSGAFAAVGAAAAAAAAVIAVEFAKMSWAAATEATDARNNLERTFGGELTDKFIANGKRAADALGIPAREYEKSVAMLGQSLEGLGFTTEESASQMDPLITRLADVAARAGTDLPQALEAFGSLLRGERDPIEKYGVAIKQSDVNARLAAQGLSGLEGEALKNAEAQASLALFMEASATSVGAFAERSETAAGKVGMISAKFEDVKASFGTLLQEGFVQVWDYLVTEVWPQVDAFLTEHKADIDAIAAAVQTTWDAWKGMWTYIGPIMEDLLPVWLFSMKLLLGALAVVASNIKSTMDNFAKMFNGIATGISTMWNAFSFAWGFIAAQGASIANAIGAVWNTVFGGIAGAVQWLSSVIKVALESPIRGFKALWNSTIGGKGFSVPDWPGLPHRGETFSIPYLAAGGIVTRPTLAMIGEAGPEAVVPLGSSGGFGNTVFNINVSTGVGDPAEIGRKVIDAIRSAERVQGSGWRVA